jgi:DNA-binding beta-propeller fold protein YncE
MQLLPEAFNYGPTVLQITPNMSTQEGGGTGVVFGYGLGPVTSSNIPSDLQIRVAGVLVRVTAFVPYAYPTSAPPFPLQAALFTIPPGTAGGPVDVTVSTANGSTTAKASLSYLPAVQQFPLPGSALAQGIYDAYRDQYYFTDAKKVQVFSRTQGKWLAPINIPGSQRLWGIALSPDGSKLAVSDPGTGDIYLLNAANTTSIKTFDVSHSQFGTLGYPCGLAVSDAGNIYYMVYVPGISGADQYFKLNTNNGTIFDYRMDSPGFGPQDIYLRNAISSDNSRVYFSDYGLVFSVDTATDQIFEALDGYGCCYGNYELALSSNQTQLTATFFIYDSDLNGQSYYALNDREILTIQYVYGAKMSPDGRLLFQPATSGIDVFDGRLGNLRNRIALPIELSPNYDALVGDGRDNVLLAITGQAGDGIAIVDLTSVVEPPPAHYAETRLSDYFHSAPGGQASHLFRLQAREGRNHSQPAIHPAAVPHVTRFPFSAGK